MISQPVAQFHNRDGGSQHVFVADPRVPRHGGRSNLERVLHREPQLQDDNPQRRSCYHGRHVVRPHVCEEQRLQLLHMFHEVLLGLGVAERPCTSPGAEAAGGIAYVEEYPARHGSAETEGNVGRPNRRH